MRDCRPGRRRTFECRGGHALRRTAPIPRACTRGCASAAPSRPSARSRRRHCSRSSASRLGAFGRRHALAADRRGARPRRVDSATLTDWLGLLAQRVERVRDVGVGRQPQRDVQADRVGLERVVAQDPAGEPLVGDHDPLLGQRAQDREVQPHVLDDAVVVLER